MRIIIAFILGVASAFYLAEFFARLWHRFHFIQKAWNIHHSLVGLIFFLAGIASFFFGQGLVGDPNHILLGIFLLGSGLGMILHHLLAESFVFSERIEKNFVRKHDTQVERFLEILPGALIWIALTSPLWLSFTLPFAVAYLIIIADIYWFITALRIATLIYLGYGKMEQAKRQDWLQKLKTDFPNQWDKYYHFLVIPTYKEGLGVLKPAFEAIFSSDYPAEKIFIGVGLEERDDPKKLDEVKRYWAKNAHKIGGVFITLHPYDLPGEIPGPGSNRNFIVRNAAKEFEKRDIKPQEVFVTTLDADFVIHPRFLAGALHKYLSSPTDTRDKYSFTGVFLYNNNYWQAPTPMRVIATGTAFWQLSEMVGSDKYINFSSLSMNMQSLLDVGLWIPDKVNDDSGFYWKAYYYFQGAYKVLPHYLPISADAVMDVNLLKTFQSQYLQLKRWAYGVEHIPFIFKQYFARKDLDFWDKTDKLLFITWSYFKWGTLALFITCAGFLIPVVNPDYTQSAVAYNLPIISSWILTGAFLSLLATIYVNEKVVPPRPANWSFFRKVWSYLQWLLIPLVLVTITSIPAIDAQTRLMLGRYMEFRVTTKTRIK